MKRLAIIPSVQDGNRYKVGGINERDSMHALARLVAAKAAAIIGLECRVFEGQPQSADEWYLEGLYSQEAAAAGWLAGTPPAECAIVNIHSDSGEKSHVAAIYGGAVMGPSYRLATTVARSVEGVFLTGDFRYLDYTGYVFYSHPALLYSGIPRALIECGSHESSHDLDVLLNRRGDLAAGILAGSIEFLGLSLAEAPAVLDPDVAYFETFGVRANPDAAIYKYWRSCRAWGDAANLGPAIAPEEPGDRYGEAGCVVQRFTNAVVVCKPAENWKCYRAQVVLEPKRWFPGPDAGITSGARA